MEVISERENLLKTMLREGLVLETPMNQAGQMKKVASLWNINFNTGYTARPVSNSVNYGCDSFLHLLYQFLHYNWSLPSSCMMRNRARSALYLGCYSHLVDFSQFL